MHHNTLITLIESTGVKDKELNWIKSYLSDRKQCVIANNVCSNVLPINYGVPKGSTIGPLMFIIYVNGMYCSLLNHSTVMYADDTIIFGSSKNLQNLIQESSDNFTSAMLWCRKHKLSVNISKTKIMIFTPKRNEKLKSKELNIGDQQISIVDDYNYLGLKIDNQLSFTSHLKTLMRNVAHKNRQFYTICKYLSTDMAVLIYKTMISPIFNYANIFLYSGPSKLLKKLQTLQNQSIRTILKVNKRTNVDNQRLNMRIHTLQNDRKINLLCLAYKQSFIDECRDHRVLNTRLHEPGRRQLIVRRPINQLYAKCYMYNSKKWWNSIPTWYQRMPNVGRFKKVISKDIEMLNALC